MPYPPSSFESGVAGFLNTLSAVQGIKANKQETRIRKQAADRADQMEQVKLDEAGYDRITMPTIEAPPDQSFAQSVGSYLSKHFRGGDEPQSVVMKTHPSAHDTNVANEQAFITSRDAVHFQTERDLEGMKAALAVKLERDRQTQENSRSAANNRTSIAVAGIDHSVQERAFAQKERQQVIDDAIGAAGGHAKQAWDSIPPAVRKKYGLTSIDMNAAVDRRNAPAEELKRARAELDLQRAGQISAQSTFLPGVKPPPAAPVGVAPLGRQPLAASDKAAAQKDAAFAAHLKSLGYVKGQDY